jgi:hypothetical protein
MPSGRIFSTTPGRNYSKTDACVSAALQRPLVARGGKAATTTTAISTFW